MKLPSTTLGVIFSFYFNTIAATNRLGDYVCEKEYFTSGIVSQFVKQCCEGLKYSLVSYKYPAALDGSALFGVRDATLFSAPTKSYRYNLNNKKHPGESRVVIDSRCRLIGLYYITDQFHKPCIKTLGVDGDSSSLSQTSSDTPPKLYGYICNKRVFLLEEVRSFYYHLHDSLRQKSIEIRFRYVIKLSKNKLSAKTVLLYPISADGKYINKYWLLSSPYRIAIDKEENLIGMMLKDGKTWTPCKNIEYFDPEPPRSEESMTNSVGEILFDNVSEYSCEGYIFSIFVVNSHMHAACKVIREDAGKSEAGKFSFPVRDPAPELRESDIRYWPFRQPEFPENGHFRKMNYFIKLDLQCNFLGVYRFRDSKFIECEKFELSLPVTGFPQVG